MATLEQALGQLFLLSFVGKQEPPDDFRKLLAGQHVAGVELFRPTNFGTLAEVRGLTDALQQLAADSGQPPLLICANQEGGQFIGIGESTPFPGNMALGATGSTELAERVGAAIGRELAALGINVNFAPVVDVNNNAQNPVIGTRSFGDDPRLVARMGAAQIRGMRSAGIAATAKHFPGHGDTTSDSHVNLPLLDHGLDRLQQIELPPFKAAIKAGAPIVMVGHLALPKLTGVANLPATLSSNVVRGLLRRRLR